MERQDYRVQRPWSTTVVQEQQVGEVLATGTRIIEVFDRPDIARQLLILGEPGSGKTMMMLELAQDLLYRARGNKAEPIPVLLSLSTWKDPKQSIFEWLLVELKAKYGLRQDLAQQWLEKNQLLPSLDGLDEVAPQHQHACALSLNAWLTGELAQRPCGVLICCRREEFEQVVREPLSLYGAIYLQALIPQQIEEYFAQFKLQDVWQTVHHDVALQELLTKPLFLSMFGLVATQRKFSINRWQSCNTFEQKVQYLFNTYWEATLERELILDPGLRKQGICSKTYGTKPPPTHRTMRRALVFAAKMLNRDSSTELLIEKIQPAALLNRWQKWAYRFIGGLIGGLSIGVILGLSIVLPYGLSNESSIRYNISIFILILGLIVGLGVGLIGGLDTIQPVEVISISISRETWRIVLRSMQKEVIFELGVWLIFGSVIGPFLGLIFALVFGIFVGLIGGLKADIQARIEPNQGMKNSVKNMIIALMIALVTAIPFTFLLEHLMASVTSLRLIVVFSVYVLIWSSFEQSGGDSLTKHLALRIVLAWNRYAPFRYDLLLNYCTERLLLQRIGGRYRFMHKLLQDHFAQMDLD